MGHQIGSVNPTSRPGDATEFPPVGIIPSNGKIREQDWVAPLLLKQRFEPGVLLLGDSLYVCLGTLACIDRVFTGNAIRQQLYRRRLARLNIIGWISWTATGRKQHQAKHSNAKHRTACAADKQTASVSHKNPYLVVSTHSKT